MPGAGFDVVPTDCLAGYVAGKLDQPASLVIALWGLESASQGTLRTAIRQISKPVLCRRAGAIVALDDRRLAGSISAPEMSPVFLFHGATLPPHFIAPA